MAVQVDDDYDRERFALYVAGLMPENYAEAQAVLALIARLLLTIQESRDHHRPAD